MKHPISTYILVLFLFSLISCGTKENKKTEIVKPSKSVKALDSIKDDLDKKAATIKTPESFKILNETEGDLDNDGVSEKVIVYDTEKETDFGTERQLYIYKKNGNAWILWKKSASSILTSEQGGVFGDPFEGILIEKNSLVINHFGGSRQKWNYTHQFKYQSGDFQLIGAKVSAGSPCEYFETFDYNLSTGQINYERETEDCEKETSKIVKKDMVKKLETLPTIDGFSPGSNKIIFPNSEITVYY
tara:strand:+ start:677 stop:1411 length:735 start_codon:yes stop_codon:yes gene_type:complete